MIIDLRQRLQIEGRQIHTNFKLKNLLNNIQQTFHIEYYVNDRSIMF